MTTIVVGRDQVSVPAAITTLEAFRDWFYSDEFPEFGQISFINGQVWVDMSKEQFFSHNQVKGEYNRVLGALAKVSRLGRYVPDGMLLTNLEVGLSTQPDGCFLSRTALRSHRIRLVEGAGEGFVELEGAADMVLEIVSASSVEKDTITLRDLYWQAGVREYWLVDVRDQRLEFDILRHSAEGYLPTASKGGWIASKVLRKSFRLMRRFDALGHPEFTLAVR